MKKSVKQILAEEAKRFRQLSEYSFIGINEADDENQDAEGGDLEAELDTLGAELQDKAPESGDDSEFGSAIPDAEDEPETEAPEAADDIAADPMMDSGGEVEVDVTDLVNTSNELKTSSIETNQKMADLIDKFNSLSDQITKMSKLGQNIEVLDKKIKDVETEIVRRNPTPTEKIEMRSLDSFPYNIKLSDFWSDNADKLSVEPEQEKPKEYVLTKADVDDYSDSDIRKSFSEFEEEDI
jgi:sugar-specific transcriptional regulator TrmB